MVHLDEEIVAVHFEIVELQRSPFARKQVDVMEQLSVSLELMPTCPSTTTDCLSVFPSEEKAIELYKQLKAKCKSERA